MAQVVVALRATTFCASRLGVLVHKFRDFKKFMYVCIWFVWRTRMSLLHTHRLVWSLQLVE
jgi:hypothetical protein